MLGIPVRSLARSFLVGVCAGNAVLFASAGHVVAQGAGCYFQLGFANLASQIPDSVGQCTANERFNAANGNAEQPTTKGLLVWRKADNWTAYTDGYRTWLAGPYGLEDRLNDGPRFAWEQEVVDVNTNANTNDVENTNTVTAGGGNATGGTANAQGGSSTNTNTNTVNPVINVVVNVPGAATPTVVPTPTSVAAPMAAPIPTVAPTPTASMAMLPVPAPVPTVSSAVPAAAAGQWVVWGRYGSGPGEFIRPVAISVAMDGTLYVRDGRQATARVQRLTPTDKCQCWWQPSGELSRTANTLEKDLQDRYSPGNDVLGVAVDPAGNVIVSHAQHISVRSANLAIRQPPWATTLQLYDAVADRFGSLYASIRGSNLIAKVGPDGKEIARWGASGSGPGQFAEPIGLAVDGQDHLYVADAGNDRIQKLSVNGGRPLAQFGKQGNGPGEFNNPTAVAVDAQGYIYVADTGNNRIQKLAPDGKFVQQWGAVDSVARPTAGNGAGQFSSPYGLAIDAKGNLYVADSENDRIQKLILNP